MQIDFLTACRASLLPHALCMGTHADPCSPGKAITQRRFPGPLKETTHTWGPHRREAGAPLGRPSRAGWPRLSPPMLHVIVKSCLHVIGSATEGHQGLLGRTPACLCVEPPTVARVNALLKAGSALMSPIDTVSHLVPPRESQLPHNFQNRRTATHRTTGATQRP